MRILDSIIKNKRGRRMLKTKKIIGRVFLILLLMLLIIILANGQDEEVIPGIEETEAEGKKINEPQELVPKVTNLDILLIDKINNSQIRLTNCILILAGELRIAEDSFTYNNTFDDGNLYKITVMIELKDTK